MNKLSVSYFTLFQGCLQNILIMHFYGKFPTKQQQAVCECTLVSIWSIDFPCMYCSRILYKAAFIDSQRRLITERCACFRKSYMVSDHRLERVSGRIANSMRNWLRTTDTVERS